MRRIYTIGYEETDIVRFVETLKIVGVRQLIDVRAVAISRKKGFSKTALRARLEESGIRYEHLIELGDPKDGRIAAREGRFSDFRSIFKAHLATSKASDTFQRLVQVAESGGACLMCYERDPTHCHRRILCDELIKVGFDRLDLFAEQPSRYEHYKAKLARCSLDQGLAAAE